MTLRALFIVAAGAAVGCAPALEVRSTREICTIQGEHIVGRDGGASVRAGDVEVWIFGDTFVDTPDADGNTFHSSTFAVSNDFDATNCIDFETPLDPVGSPRRFLDDTEEERAFNLAHLAVDGACAEEPCGERRVTWPGVSVRDDANDRIITFYERIRAGVGDFNFRGDGVSVAIWSSVEDRPARVEPPLFAADGPRLGTAAAIGDDGLLYAFGCDLESLSAPCTLGRVAPADVAERSAWRFYDGSAFVDDASHAATVIDGGAINSLHFNEHLGRWIAVYSPSLSDDVVARTAERIEGPWSSPVTLFAARQEDAEAWTYDAHAHPGLATDDATLIISYTRSDGTLFGRVTALVEVVLE